MRIRHGDVVQILTGKDRGKRGTVLRVMPKTGRVVVEGLNIKKKHARPRKQGEKGQIVEFPAALPAAKVGLVCRHCQKVTRVSIHVGADGKKERRCQKCRSAVGAS